MRQCRFCERIVYGSRDFCSWSCCQLYQRLEELRYAEQEAQRLSRLRLRQSGRLVLGRRNRG